MRRILSFYVYFLAVFPIIDIFELVADPRPAVIVRIIVEVVIAYIVIKGYLIGYYHRLSIGSTLYGFGAIGTLIIASILGSFQFYLLAAFALFGCYVLGFSTVARYLRLKTQTRSDNGNAAMEFEKSIDYTEYKGQTIRKSRNYYWVDELRFSDIKKAEAHIENRP
jgi:hypothetical protein